MNEYPKGTINALVKDKLEQMAKRLTEFGKAEGETSE